jgi:hypothetical protein
MYCTQWLRALGRAMARQACRACIERCGLIAGSAAGGEALALLFDDVAPTRRQV